MRGKRLTSLCPFLGQSFWCPLQHLLDLGAPGHFFWDEKIACLLDTGFCREIIRVPPDSFQFRHELWIIFLQFVTYGCFRTPLSLTYVRPSKNVWIRSDVSFKRLFRRGVAVTSRTISLVAFFLKRVLLVFRGLSSLIAFLDYRYVQPRNLVWETLEIPPVETAGNKQLLWTPKYLFQVGSVQVWTWADLWAICLLLPYAWLYRISFEWLCSFDYLWRA